MKFTFGIITSGNNDLLVNKIIDSIENENIEEYEILIIGGSTCLRNNTKVYPFNELERNGWITRKKNLITKYAKYDNIVYLHDYIKLNEGWYKGQCLAGDNFKIRMDKIINYDGTRFRDWSIWPHNGNFMDDLIGRNCLIPYDMKHLSKYQYISGSYWIAKKEVMEKYPLDERLTWGQGEDVLWSKLVRLEYDFDMNSSSSVYIMKPNKDRAFDETTPEQIKKLNEL